MADHTILFAGPMGAGKTTAIRAVSDIPVVSTEAANLDRAQADKDTTTVALDYGEINLNDEEKIRLYGVPGQNRFDFMWDIIQERAFGLLLLVNNDAPDAVGQAVAFVSRFKEMHEKGGIVIGITRSDVSPKPDIQQYSDALEENFPDIVAPIFTIDVREAMQVKIALMALTSNIEAKNRVSGEFRAKSSAA